MNLIGESGAISAPLPYAAFDALEHQLPVWQDWMDRLPNHPLCADQFSDGMFRRPREAALGYRHIEINPPGRVAWLAFDIDRDDAFDAPEKAGLPAPNATCINHSNGHGHLLYALASPVGLAGMSRRRPIQLLQDVERGMMSRLRADPAYVGRFAKNPGHRDWRTLWLTPKPFFLKELAEYLDPNDKRKSIDRTDLTGHGRNVDLFDLLRKFAYGEVVSFQRTVGVQSEWKRRLIEVAMSSNRQFNLPLPISEVRSIASSVARWTWEKFSPEQFAELQSLRASIGNIKRGRRTSEIIEQVSNQLTLQLPTTAAAPEEGLYPDMADVLLVPRSPRAGPMAKYSAVTQRSPRTIRRYAAEPRSRYEARSISRSQPWKKEGISRRTWYRRRKEIEQLDAAGGPS